jgi:tetratricopeptide (TPR) repeat protein
MGWGIRIMPLLFRILLILLIAVASGSCSTQKNTALTRSYHQVTSRYNTFFNGRESYRSGVRRSEQQFRYDYNRILPVFLYTDPDIAKSVAPEMDRAISKASKIIANKSITVRPRERGGLSIGRNGDFFRQSEYNKWVRESYLLAGKAHFYKHDYVPAAQAFLFIIREYSMNDIRHEGKVWLARTHCERGRFHEAAMLLEDILADPDFPVALYPELYSTIGDFHLKQEQFEQAAVYLEKALETAGNNDQKIRYTYILAQLYERTGNFPRASEYYSRVIRMNPPYEMVFNARVSQAGVIQSGGNETARMINELERMLKDDKNREYHDQIYYALGNTHLRNNDEDNAIKYFTMSAGARGSNPSQKATTYLALADIYFNHADYLTAQSYFDSVVVNLNPAFPDRNAIIEKSNILNELAGYIRLYELEDSVQRLAVLTETERNRKVDDIIALDRKNEAEARQRQQQAQQSSQFMSARISQAARRQTERSGGNWYFYNQSALAFGQNEFEALWGERSLEDNWRRSNRQVVSSDQFVMMNDEEHFPVSVDGEPAETRSRDYYMRNIPLTPEDMAASHNRLAGSLFNMGIIYRDDLKDFERSAEAHKELIRRYPAAEQIPAAYYNLHSVSVINSNTSEADHYKNIIVSKYPDTPYAAILTNPDYFLEYEKKIQEAESHYEKTFELYKAKRFDEVREMADYGMSTWPESLLVPRFEYLKTLSFGPENNIPLFRNLLSDYITRYPGTEMAEDAHRFLSYIENDYPELIQLAKIPSISTFYKPVSDGAHHFVIIINNRQEIINRMIFNIVNFNVDNFAIHELNLTGEQFSNNYHLIRVNGLPDVTVALDYFNKFFVSGEVFAEAGGDDYHAFLVSPENFILFMQDKNINSYLKFFEDEYLDPGRHSVNMLPPEMP